MRKTLGDYLEIFLPVVLESGMEVSYFALHTPDNVMINVGFGIWDKLWFKVSIIMILRI